MVTDGEIEELHKFALRIGLKIEWFQNKKQNHKHYDLITQRMRKRAVLYGAELVSSKQIIRILKGGN